MSDEKGYVLPPSDYRPPEKCKACKRRIIFAPVADGERWMHLSPPADDHNVVMPKQWWDVRTGRWRRGVWGVKPRSMQPVERTP